MGGWIELVNDVAAGTFLSRVSLPSHLFHPSCLLSELRLQHGSCEARKDSTVETREEQNVLSVAQLALRPSHSLFKLPLCQHSFPLKSALLHLFWRTCVHVLDLTCAIVLTVQVPYILRREGGKYWHRGSRRGKLEDESEAESMSTSPWAESNKLH